MAKSYYDYQKYEIEYFEKKIDSINFYFDLTLSKEQIKQKLFAALFAGKIVKDDFEFAIYKSYSLVDKESVLEFANVPYISIKNRAKLIAKFLNEHALETPVTEQQVANVNKVRALLVNLIVNENEQTFGNALWFPVFEGNLLAKYTVQLLEELNSRGYQRVYQTGIFLRDGKEPQKDGASQERLLKHFNSFCNKYVENFSLNIYTGRTIEEIEYYKNAVNTVVNTWEKMLSEESKKDSRFLAHKHSLENLEKTLNKNSDRFYYLRNKTKHILAEAVKAIENNTATKQQEEFVQSVVNKIMKIREMLSVKRKDGTMYPLNAFRVTKEHAGVLVQQINVLAAANIFTDEQKHKIINAKSLLKTSYQDFFFLTHGCSEKLINISISAEKTRVDDILEPFVGCEGKFDCTSKSGFKLFADKTKEYLEKNEIPFYDYAIYEAGICIFNGKEPMSPENAEVKDAENASKTEKTQHFAEKDFEK